MSTIACRLVLTALLAFAATGVQADPHLYRFDTVHSRILFSIGHNGYSHALGLLRIKDGWLRYDPDDYTHAATVLDIDLTSTDMGDSDWSRTVRGKSLLDAVDHPLAHFVSTSVHQTGPHSGRMHGKLTLRGNTHKVIIDFSVNRIGATVFEMNTVAGFSATAQLDRNTFGITRNPGSIGKTVTLRLEIEAQRDDDARRAYRNRKPPAHASAH